MRGGGGDANRERPTVIPLAVHVNGDTAPFAEGTRRVGPVEVAVMRTDDGAGSRYELTVRHPGRQSDLPIALHEIGLSFPARPERVLEHGWQSWSVVRRCRPDDVRPDRRDIPMWASGTHQADPGRAGRVVSGDQFLVWDAGVAGFLRGERHLSVVDAFPDRIVAVALLDGIELEGGGEWALDPLWVAAGDPGPLYSELAGRWGRASGARVPATTVAGWCSWYQYFAKVTPEQIVSNAALAARHGLEVVQIDDGYQRAIGDWLETNARWPDGTGHVAAQVHAAGLEAGIWTAPFLAGEDSAIARSHPEWLASFEGRRPLRATYNPASWGGWALALDTTRPEVLDHLTATFGALRAQGFRYHKIDFCYAAALPGGRSDRSLTRAQMLRQGLMAVRAGIGQDAFLLGCGCPLAQAVGIVDAMRVSPDVAPYWNPKQSWPGYEESAVAAGNAVRASVLRAPLHRRLFLNDPDCLVIRPTDTELTAAERSALLATIQGTGAFLVASDDMARYSEAEWRVLDEARHRAGLLDAPLDLIDPFARDVGVQGPSHTLTADWRVAAAELRISP